VTAVGGFGADTINGFDANPTGGQDLIDLHLAGITAANFAANVTKASDGAGGTLVKVLGQGTIRIVGVAPANITIQDFKLT
jgi:hypothetical protein